VRVMIVPVMIAAMAVSLALPGPAALAQSSPSADQIINSLKPSGNLNNSGTRGIRMAAPTSEPTATPAPPAGAPVHPRVASNRPMTGGASSVSGPAVNLTVNFPNGSADLTPEAMRTLNELGRALASKELAGYRFRIEGHTDTVGSREYNRLLSERRAAAVVQYIARSYGIEPSRLEAVGMGDEGLLIPTPPQTPEPRNRRVQVINVGT
jgi:OmpA-OmpF porin, OOP family